MPYKIHFGCGSHRIEGWENHDIEVDIRDPLPYSNESAEFIFCEHCVEHVTPQQAWEFFEECHRILVPGGVVRIAIPDFIQLSALMTEEYREAVRAGGHGDGTKRAALRAVVFEHGHQGLWSNTLLAYVLNAVGFSSEIVAMNKSSHPELDGIDQHWKTVGFSIAETETGVVEGTKT